MLGSAEAITTHVVNSIAEVVQLTDVQDSPKLKKLSESNQVSAREVQPGMFHMVPFQLDSYLNYIKGCKPSHAYLERQQNGFDLVFQITLYRKK